MRGLALPLAAAVLAIAPGAAHASVASLEGGIPTAKGQPGEQNEMTARAEGDTIVFTDTVALQPGDGCERVSDFEVRCPGEGSAILLGEDGDDKLRDAGLTTGFGAQGGPGGDEIIAAAAPAQIHGDGKTVGEGDGNDRITGSSAAAASGNDFDDFINGGGGDDEINAGAGIDHASGQAGTDTIDGGDGDDVLDSTDLFTDADEDAPGDVGDDVLRGGAGNDQLRGTRGRDKLNGDDGDDYLIATDIDIGRDDATVDTLSCGAGSDRFAPGFSDRVALGCERALLMVDCRKNYPCAVKGSIYGYRKGSKKATAVGKVGRSITSPQPVEIKIGKNASKVLGSAKKTFLSVDLVGRRGTKVVTGVFFRFYLTK